MTEQLSSFRIKRGRRVFDSYSAINSFSFALVTGNTITLYALALGASQTVIGFLGAFMYLSFFAIPLGKMQLKKTSLIKTFANNWMYRTLSLVPLLVIPYFAAIGIKSVAIVFLVACVFMFNFFRGIGLIANNPVIGMLSPGKDRGEYIVRLSLINNGTALVATVILALLLWRHAGLQTYNLVVLIGILTGMLASSLLYKLPDSGAPPSPENYSTAKTGVPAGGNFYSKVKEAFRERNFRLFIASYLIIGLGIGIVRPFIIVYSRDVYAQVDSVLTIFTVCSSIGALFTGSIMRLVIDRLGAKPLYIIFSSISLFSLLPAIVAPGVGIAVFSLVFLALLSAVTNMGFAGQENSAQAYFFGMVSKESLMDLSMLYFFYTRRYRRSRFDPWRCLPGFS
jgi:MFS family permease